MKIVNIFANKLFAFHYENYSDNEYERLMELWTNVNFLKFMLKTTILKMFKHLLMTY